MKKGPLFYSKILLFGEYGIIKDSKGLSIPYNFYNGDHGRTLMYLPWFHLLFSDQFIINRVNKKSNLQINKIEDLGLNKYSFKDYEKIFKNSNFQIKFYITNQSDHPISKIFNLLSKLKIFKEYCTYNIYCILQK